MLQNINMDTSSAEEISVRSPLTRYEELLLLCFYSGQIELTAWEQHLLEHPVLASYSNRQPSVNGTH